MKIATPCVLNTFSMHLEARRMRVCQYEAFTTQDHGRCKCTDPNMCEWNRVCEYEVHYGELAGTTGDKQ